MAVSLRRTMSSINTLWTVDTEEDGKGNIDIVASNDSDSWSLFKLKKDGTFYRYPDVGEDSGFQLTHLGEIVESENED